MAKKRNKVIKMLICAVLVPAVGIVGIGAITAKTGTRKADGRGVN